MAFGGWGRGGLQGFGSDNLPGVGGVWGSQTRTNSLGLLQTFWPGDWGDQLYSLGKEVGKATMAGPKHASAKADPIQSRWRSEYQSASPGGFGD